MVSRSGRNLLKRLCIKRPSELIAAPLPPLPLSRACFSRWLSPASVPGMVTRPATPVAPGACASADSDAVDRDLNMTSIVARRGHTYLAATRRASARHASTSAPVTPAEFYEHLLRCTPPGGWRDSIGLLLFSVSAVRPYSSLPSQPLQTLVARTPSACCSCSLLPSESGRKGNPMQQAYFRPPCIPSTSTTECSLRMLKWNLSLRVRQSGSAYRTPRYQSPGRRDRMRTVRQKPRPRRSISVGLVLPFYTWR